MASFPPTHPRRAKTHLFPSFVLSRDLRCDVPHWEKSRLGELGVGRVIYLRLT